jgi:hypothetical protein
MTDNHGRRYIQSDVTKKNISVKFDIARYVISPNQKFDGVTTPTSGGGIDVKAGRHSSAGPAAVFVQNVTLANVIATKPKLKQLPKKLQVVVIGNLTMTFGDAPPVTCENFRMGLAEDVDHVPVVGYSYYWWLSGGLKCVSVPTTAVMKCVCGTQSTPTAKVEFHVADGAHKVYVLLG